MGLGTRGRLAGRGAAKKRKRLPTNRTKILTVKSPESYSGHAEILINPEVIGRYSVDRERDFGHDKSLLHFMDRKYLPDNGEMKVELDLNKGLENFNRYSGNTEDTFQNFLKWIVNNKDCFTDETSHRLDANFISLKGNFIKIMKMPYISLPWTFYATEFKGSVYIVSQAMGTPNIPNVDMERLEQWGHTFVHYMRGGDPNDGVDANGDYRCALKTLIGETSLVYPAGVDCVDPEQYVEDFKDLDAFLLVKNCAELTTKRKKQIQNPRGNLFHWWAENQLCGVPRTVVGYRNDDGVVHTLELLKTDEIPERAGGQWDPNVLFNFLVKFLGFVKDMVSQDPETVYVFHCKSTKIYCKKSNVTDDIDLLPEWYTNGLFAEEDSEEESE